MFILVSCVEFEFSEYPVLESTGLLNVTLLLTGKAQPISFNVTVIANDTESSTAIGNTIISYLKCTHEDT